MPQHGASGVAGVQRMQRCKIAEPLAGDVHRAAHFMTRIAAMSALAVDEQRATHVIFPPAGAAAAPAQPLGGIAFGGRLDHSQIAKGTAGQIVTDSGGNTLLAQAAAAGGVTVFQVAFPYRSFGTAGAAAQPLTLGTGLLGKWLQYGPAAKGLAGSDGDAHNRGTSLLHRDEKCSPPMPHGQARMGCLVIG